MSSQPTGRSVHSADGGSAADRFLSAVAVDGEVLFAGPATGDVLGVDRRTLVGDDLLECVHPDEPSGSLEMPRLREDLDELERGERGVERAPGAVFEVRAPTPAAADDGEPWVAR
ncbi:hypothetical protein JCM17823_17060 [Halorubrum gandharaense]